MNFADLISGEQPLGPGQPVKQPQSSIETLTQGQQQMPLNFSAPQNEQELVQRQEGWKGFIDAVRNNTELRNALLMASGELLQGHQIGENPAAPLGRALQTGTGVYQVGQQRKAQNEFLQRQENRADRQEERAVRESNASIDNTTARTEGERQRTSFEAQRQPLELQSQQNQLQQQQFQLDNQQTLLNDQMQNSASQRALQSAQALHARARAAAAGREGQRQPSTDEIRMQLFKQANPEATDQEIAKMVLDYGQKTPTTINSEIKALSDLVTNGDPRDPFTQMAQDKLSLHLGLQYENPPQETGAGNQEWTPQRTKAFKEAAKKANADGTFEFEGQRWKLN